MLQRITPKILEPSLANYLIVMNEYDNLAKNNPKEQFLFIQFFASHGYIIGGYQCIATPFYDALHDFYQMISVEKEIRSKARGKANVFYLVFFAACRVILN